MHSQPLGQTVEMIAELGQGALVATTSALSSIQVVCSVALTASRSGEVWKARVDEVNIEAAIWTIPADKMKMKRKHRVPLSGLAMQILAEAREMADGSGLILPSARGRPPSDNTLSKLLREQGIRAVVHGFRSSFRDWCAKCSEVRK